MVQLRGAGSGFLLRVFTERNDQKVYLTDIRLAKATNQRPSAVILRDRYAGHRHHWDPYWEFDPDFDEARATAWTEWDYSLASVCQLLEDYTDQRSGQFIPYDQSPDIEWTVKSSFSYATAAIDKERDSRGDKGLQPGEDLYAVPKFDNPDNKPTIESWLNDMDSDDPPVPRGARNAAALDENGLLDLRETWDQRVAEVRRKREERRAKNAIRYD